MKKFNIAISIIAILLLLTIFTTNAFAENYNLLNIGSRGSEVVNLQKALNEQGYNSGVIDGIYGYNTKSAVTNFQKSNSLVVDGIAGQNTQSKLYSSNKELLKYGMSGKAIL